MEELYEEQIIYFFILVVLSASGCQKDEKNIEKNMILKNHYFMIHKKQVPLIS